MSARACAIRSVFQELFSTAKMLPRGKSRSFDSPLLCLENDVMNDVVLKLIVNFFYFFRQKV